MPKNTFYKIGEGKQLKIIKSGQELFSKHFFENVDVKMIVELAGIPRGSFYAYFLDIEDFYLTTVKPLQEKRLAKIIELSNEPNISFFDLLLKIYDNDISESLFSDQKLLVQHHFRYIQTQSLGFHYKESTKFQRPIFDVFKQYQSNFNLEDQEWHDLLEFCMNVLLSTYMTSIRENLSKERSIKLFRDRISIIKRGVTSL
ncbi:TetR/AcrR family transcriptional regulator [Mycoplasmatota bacterium WC30]